MKAFSIVVPVYNRAVEVAELLDSLVWQNFKDFEVIIVEDGSQEKSEQIVNDFKTKLDIQYHFKENSGPGQSRNYGAKFAQSPFVVFLDSDCVLPQTYTETLDKALKTITFDAFGGPDAAHDQFTDWQKAVNFSMTAFLTTGGIRGGGEKMEKFHPRSFNMGFSKEVFDKTGGFSKLRFGEDIDMSIRIHQAGYKTILLKDAFVYHKRRSTIRQFFKQIYNSGIARINLFKMHPSSLRWVHFMPSCLLVGLVFCLVLFISGFQWAMVLPILYAILLFLSAFRSSKSLKVALLGLVAAFVQISAYGLGFMHAFVQRIILNRGSFSAFEKNFYK